MFLLVGLGNPGRKYARNRHNIGFMAVDRITRRQGFPPLKAKFHGRTAQGTVAGMRVLALKPMTYMNESGRSVGAAARFFKIPTQRIIVLHDDIDLAPGKIRVKRGGTPAGHNGLKSIDSRIGRDYWRVRIGVGHPGGRDKVTGHVLDDFARSDRAWLDPTLEAVADALPLLLEEDAAAFTNKVSLLLGPPKKRPRSGQGAGPGLDSETGANSGSAKNGQAKNGATAAPEKNPRHRNRPRG